MDFDQPRELDIFARLYARKDQAAALAALLVAHLDEVRQTAGCVVIHDYVSVRDARLLYIHSIWQSEDAFQNYARLPSTGLFVQAVEQRLDRPPLHAVRARAMERMPPEATRRGDIYVFAALQASPSHEKAVEQALQRVHEPTAREAGCASHQIYRSLREPGLYYVHSVWQNEAAFERHVGLPHTVDFVQQINRVIAQPLEVTRTRQLA